MTGRHLAQHEHDWNVIAVFESRGCIVRECRTCGATATSWLGPYIPVGDS